LADRNDSKTSARKRVDVLLVERGLFESRARARAAIESGGVTADGRPVLKVSELIAANAERLSSDAEYADAVRRFVAAVVKGTDEAIANPDEATSIMKQDTDYKPTFLDESVPYTLKLLKPASGTKTGCIDVANWQSYGEWMSSNQLITSTPDASAIATTDYMPYSCS